MIKNYCQKLVRAITHLHHKWSVLGVLAVLAITISSVSAESSSAFHSQRFPYQITYPAEFSLVKAADERVDFFLQHNEGNFPTFNILVENDPLKSDKSTHYIGKEVLYSYHQVGLTDAELVSTTRRAIGGREGVFLELRYTVSEQTMRAAVVTLSDRALRYYLTFVAPTDAGDDIQGLHQQLLSSFSLTTPVPEEIETTSQNDLTYLAFAVLGYLLILFCLYVRRNAKS